MSSSMFPTCELVPARFGCCGHKLGDVTWQLLFLESQALTNMWGTLGFLLCQPLCHLLHIVSQGPVSQGPVFNTLHQRVSAAHKHDIIITCAYRRPLRTSPAPSCALRRRVNESVTKRLCYMTWLSSVSWHCMQPWMCIGRLAVR
jgi:hypothetical protein